MALLLAISTAAVGQARSQSLRKPRSGKVSLLYVVNAARGTLTSGPRGQLTLTLSGLERHAVWFSDRPSHRSGSFPSSGITAGWSGFGFTTEPPNAALDYTDQARGPGRTVILELTRPRLRRNRLIFTARIIDPATVARGDLAGHARRADRTPPKRLINPTLFIDDTTAPVVGGCILQPYTDCSNDELSGVDLAGANLTGANLYYANISYSNLAGANLTNTYSWGTDFQNANLTHANLSGGNFGGANLQWANLTDANLTNTYLWAALTGANLSGAAFCNTTIGGGSVISLNCP